MDIQKATDANSVHLEIQELKTQRNTHAFISSLPDEILLEIFMVLMADFPVEIWYQVSHVCRHWRHVAVGAPMLWTKPNTAKHRFTTLMLQRSKTAVLTIQLDSYTSTQTAEALLDCIGRIESLTINEHGLEDEDPRLLQVLLKELGQEASRLKELEIFYLSNRNIHAILRLLRPSHQLQRLLVSSILFNWNALPLHNLRYLFFDDITFPASISMQQFIDILRQMPLLESLVLPFSGDLLTPHALPAPTKAKLTLPCLRLLCLANSLPEHTLYFLAHTEFPQLRHLELQIEDAHGHTTFMNDYYTAIIQAISSSVTNGNFGTFEGISIGPCSLELLMLSGARYESSYSINSQGLPKSPYIHLDVIGRPGREEGINHRYPRMPLDLFELCAPNLSRLLNLEICDVLTETEFMRLFGRPCCSYIQKIAIPNGANVIPMLATVLQAPSHPISPTIQVLFPDLKSISCSGQHFATPAGSCVLDALCACLVSRRGYGYPLHELELMHCSVTSVQVAQLMTVVVNLKYTTPPHWQGFARES